MIWVYWPAIGAYCNIKAPRLDRLNVPRMMRPTNALQIVHVIEQIKVSLVRLQVVNNSRLGAGSAAFEHDVAALVLAPEPISQQCLLTQYAPCLCFV